MHVPRDEKSLYHYRRPRWPATMKVGRDAHIQELNRLIQHHKSVVLQYQDDQEHQSLAGIAVEEIKRLTFGLLVSTGKHPDHPQERVKSRSGWTPRAAIARYFEEHFHRTGFKSDSPWKHLSCEQLYCPEVFLRGCDFERSHWRSGDDRHLKEWTENGADDEPLENMRKRVEMQSLTTVLAQVTRVQATMIPGKTACLCPLSADRQFQSLAEVPVPPEDLPA